VLGVALFAVLNVALAWGPLDTPSAFSLDGPVIKLLFDPRTRHLFVLYNHPSPSCSDAFPDAVQVIDTTRRAVVRTVEPVPAMDMSLNEAAGNIAISESGTAPCPAGQILLLDAASGRILHTTTTHHPCSGVLLNPVSGHILSSCGAFDGRSGRAVVMCPAAVHVSVVGSKISALERELEVQTKVLHPPATSTVPSGSCVAVCQRRGVLILAAGNHLPVRGL
jgi:hypothetical protein